MKRLLSITLLTTALITAPVFAHHPAADIVDEEIYAMIDELVSDTPHADLSFTDMGSGMTELTITSRTLTEVDNMIDDGLLDYAALLDGDVRITIDFEETGAVTLTINQR